MAVDSVVFLEEGIKDFVVQSVIAFEGSLFEKDGGLGLCDGANLDVVDSIPF